MAEIEHQIIDCIKKNEKVLLDFYNANKENRFYEFRKFKKYISKKSNVLIASEKHICEIAYELISLASKLYRYVPGYEGAYIRFTGDERGNAEIWYNNNSQYLESHCWKVNGCLSKIIIARLKDDNTYDDWNTDAQITGINVVVKESKQVYNFCVYGFDGCNIQHYPNPMQLAEIGIRLTDKVRRDFELTK